MKTTRLFSTAIFGVALSMVGLPALAMPQIASGDRTLPTDVEGCLTRADSFISGLGVQSSSGEIARTGYFGDGSFRLVCYPNPYAENEGSLVVVFAVHESDYEVVASFVQVALEEMGQEGTPE
jgi:hypothetical protein